MVFDATARLKVQDRFLDIPIKIDRKPLYNSNGLFYGNRYIVNINQDRPHNHDLSCELFTAIEKFSMSAIGITRKNLMSNDIWNQVHVVILFKGDVLYEWGPMKHIEQAKNQIQKVCAEMGESKIGSPFLIRFTGKNVMGFGILLKCDYYQFNGFIDRVTELGLSPDFRQFTILEDSLFLDELWIDVPEDYKFQWLSD